MLDSQLLKEWNYVLYMILNLLKVVSIWQQYVSILRTSRNPLLTKTQINSI